MHGSLPGPAARRAAAAGPHPAARPSARPLQCPPALAGVAGGDSACQVPTHTRLTHRRLCSAGIAGGDFGCEAQTLEPGSGRCVLGDVDAAIIFCYLSSAGRNGCKSVVVYERGGCWAPHGRLRLRCRLVAAAAPTRRRAPPASAGPTLDPPGPTAPAAAARTPAGLDGCGNSSVAVLKSAVVTEDNGYVSPHVTTVANLEIPQPFPYLLTTCAPVASLAVGAAPAAPAAPAVRAAVQAAPRVRPPRGRRRRLACSHRSRPAHARLPCACRSPSPRARAAPTARWCCRLPTSWRRRRRWARWTPTPPPPPATLGASSAGPA